MRTPVFLFLKLGKKKFKGVGGSFVKFLAGLKILFKVEIRNAEQYLQCLSKEFFFVFVFYEFQFLEDGCYY